MIPVSMTNSLGVALLLGAAFLMPAPAPAQAPEDQFRVICKDPALQQRILARAQAEGEEMRREVEVEIEMRCAQIDLPSTPIHGPANASPDAGHTDWVYDARYSPDGRMIVSASRDGTVRVWEADTGKPIRRIVAAEEKPIVGAPRPGIVRSATFVGDGTRIAAVSDDNPVRLFDVASGELIADLPFAGARPDSFAPKIAATTSGLLFLAGEKNEVDAIDSGTRTMRYRLAGHDAEASAIAVSETADLLATAASNDLARPEWPANPRVQLWRLSTGEKLAEFVPEGDPRPSALAFSRDGAQLAVAAGGSVHIYAVAPRRVLRTITVHPKFGVFAVAFTADGKGLISCQSHPILWDLATGQKVRHFGPFSELCHSVDVSPDGRFAVTTSMGSDVRVWEIATGAFYRQLGIDVHPPR